MRIHLAKYCPGWCLKRGAASSLTLLFLTLFTSTTAASPPTSPIVTLQRHIVWEKIQQPDSIQVRFSVGNPGSEVQHFMTQDKRIAILQGDEWELTPTIGGSEHLQFHPYPDRDGTLYASLFDTAFHSTSWVYESGVWRSLNLEHSVPIRGYARSPEGCLFARGDWGSLFMLDGQAAWKAVASPSDQHLTALLPISRSELWIGTRGDGIYHVKNDVTTRHPIPEPGLVDVRIVVAEADGSVAFLTTSDNWYWIRDGVLGSDPPESYRPPDHLLNVVNYTGVRGVFRDAVNLYHVQSDTLLVVAHRDERFEILTYDSKTRALAMDRAGRLYRGIPSEGLHFHENTDTYRAAGYPSDSSIGLLAGRITPDTADDLLLLTTGDAQAAHLLARTPGTSYQEVTYSSKLGRLPNLLNAVIADFTRNGHSDILHYGGDENRGYRLGLSRNLGQGTLIDPIWIDTNSPFFEPVSSLQQVDFDGDGDLDIFMTFYYGQREDRRGGVRLIENKGWGRFTESIDAFEEMVGFNSHALFADFDGDGRLDLFLGTRWTADRLFYGRKGGWNRADTTAIPSGGSRTLRTGALASDFNGDGSLDLILTNYYGGPEFWENDSAGKFTDVTYQWLPDREELFTGTTLLSLAAGDIDLDGHPDLIAVLRRTSGDTLLLLLHQGTHFAPVTTPVGLEGLSPHLLLLLDVDLDGDLDLLVAEEKRNRLFINRTSVEDRLAVSLQGRRSNSEGQHAKVTIYPAGHEDSKSPPITRGWMVANHLSAMSASLQAPNKLFFGGLHQKTVDIHVHFHGGGEVWKRDIPVGGWIEIREPYSFSSLTYPVAGILAVQFSRPFVRVQTVSFILTILLLFSAAILARRHLNWGTLPIAGLLLLNQGAFWVLVMFVMSSTNPLRFIVPIGFVVVGTLAPLGISHFLKRFRQVDQKKLSDELLQHLLVFNHGEWAINNLNSLKRLILHYLRLDAPAEPLYEQTLDRIRSWNELTRPNLLRLTELADQMKVQTESVGTLKAAIKLLDSSLITFITPELKLPDPQLAVNVEGSIEDIRFELRRLKAALYKHYTCDCVAVINQTVDSLSSLLETRGIKMEIHHARESIATLIPGYELAGILDNAIRNAVDALQGSLAPLVSIRSQSLGSKVHIEIEDTGIGIESGQEEAIFLEGVSGTQGSGLGLPQARETLKRYGGGIRLLSTSTGQGALFRIDLNEGVGANERNLADHR